MSNMFYCIWAAVGVVKRRMFSYKGHEQKFDLVFGAEPFFGDSTK
jgi:hypothetical protein